jgi:hypothetical protein
MKACISPKVSLKFSFPAVVAFLAMWAAAAQAVSPDVGMVTALNDGVTYWNKAEKGQPAAVQAFMKVRQGDRFKLSANAVLKVLYFNTGRQETWQGPRLLTAGPGASEAEGGGQPKVEMVSVKIAGKIKAAPLPLPRSNLQFSGVIRTMGAQRQRSEPKAAPQTVTGQKAEQEIAQARKVYREWRQKAEPADFTPEMYLLSVLAEHDRYREMDQTIAEMLVRKPGDPALKQLQIWVRTQMAQPPPQPSSGTRQD